MPERARLKLARCEGVGGPIFLPVFEALILAHVSGVLCAACVAGEGILPFKDALILAHCSGDLLRPVLPAAIAALCSTVKFFPLRDSLIFLQTSGVKVTPSPPSLPFTNAMPNPRASRMYLSSAVCHSFFGISRRTTRAGVPPTERRERSQLPRCVFALEDRLKCRLNRPAGLSAFPMYRTVLVPGSQRA